MRGREAIDQTLVELALAPNVERRPLADRITTQAEKSGVYPAAIGPVYRALSAGDLPPMTIPAFNVRGLTYELARVIWRTALELEAGPIIFELAPPEASACDQTFDEYAAMILAAAYREGYRGPVFLQGDHFSLDKPEDLPDLRKLAESVISAGYYQLDIDGSHLVNDRAAELTGFHSPNASATAELAVALRSCQPSGIEIVLGGEVGEIGGRNTTPEDLIAFHTEFQRFLPESRLGLDKISAQTGTTHSGIVLPDGSTGRMRVDFDLVSGLSRQARRLGWTGLVQHGASTLDFQDLARLPEAGVIEVHLATQIQNIVFDHPAFPKGLRSEMMRRLTVSRHGAEGDLIEDDQSLSEAQRFYQARWAAWGIFKRELWDLPRPVLDPIGASLSDWVGAILKALRVSGKANSIDHYFEVKY
jgi:fructose/tagatose bisphosphate aldolase